MRQNDETAENKTVRRFDLWFCLGGIIAIILAVWAFCPSAPQRKSGSEQAVVWTPKVYTNDIVMTAERMTIPIPFGYHLDINYGYAPLHAVVDAATAAQSKQDCNYPGNTDYGVIQGITLEFDQGREPVPTVLHCTYTQVNTSYKQRS